MDQVDLLFVTVAIAGAYVARWTARLSPLPSEAPLKAAVGTAAAAVAVALPLLGRDAPDALRIAAGIAAALGVGAPLLLVVLARARRYGIATRLRDALYWTPEGRGDLARVIAQAALARGDAEAAVAQVPDDPRVRVQAEALRGAWARVLAVEPDGRPDPALRAARVEALLGLDRLEEAERELVALQRDRRETGDAPAGVRALKLAEARVAARRGDVIEAQERLEEAPGLPAWQAFEVLADGLERLGRGSDALELRERAYRAAPDGVRPRLAEPLRAAGLEPSEAPERDARTSAPATLGILALVALAFAGQLWLDARYAVNLPVTPSQVVAAFVVGVPVPEADAWWRTLSTALVHGGLVHVGFNLWVLFDLGRVYEARRGWGPTLASFVVGTAAGALLTLALDANGPVVLVGASGGVLGIAGALLADVLRGRVGADRALLRSLLQWMAMIALLSVAIPNVSLWGHVGGALGGFAVGLARQALPAAGPVAGALDRFAGAAAAAALGAAAIAAVRLALAVFV